MKQLWPDHESLSALCRSLAQMYHAGIGPGDALSLMAEDEGAPREKALLETMSRQADEGNSLSRIFRDAGCFPSYLCSLMAVGEQVGRSEDTLNALADYYEGRARLERQLKNTLLYPSILLVVLLAVVLVLLTRVLPVFNDVYARLGSRLTGVAGGLLALGSILRAALPVLGVLLAAAVCLAMAAAYVPAVRNAWLSLWQRRCGDRGLGRKINTARFVQALSLGVSGGMAHREAVELAATLVDGSAAFRRRCDACLEKLVGGASLSGALRETELLSNAQCRLLETGTRAGCEEQALEQISGKLLEDVESELDCAAGRIEPTVVVIMSVLVGAILLSVMLPLMHIMTALG